MIKIERSFEHYHTPKHIYYDRLHKRFDFMMRHIKGPSVIDIGCGIGLTPYLLAQRDDIDFIVGIDIQQEALAEAKQNVKSQKAWFFECASENLPFINKIFNTVVITETLEHVKSVNKTLSEAHRVLKSDGNVIITVPNEGRLGKGKGLWVHVRIFNKENLLERTNQYFKCIKVGIIENYLYYVGIVEWGVEKWINTAI